MMISLLEMMMQTIPMILLTWIFLMMTCLTILLYAPPRVVMTLTTVWLSWKLKLNAARA